MLVVLKSIHLLCLLVAGAASIGNAVLMKRVSASGAPPPPMVADAMGVLARMGLGGIVVLWLTGLPLAWMTNAFAAGWAFWAKLVAATIVLALVPAMMALRRQAAKARRPPDAVLLGRLALVARLSAVGAIILAVVAFR